MPPDPARLLAQADNLAAHAYQEDWRRAISAAYYGLFHFVLTAAAEPGSQEQQEAFLTLLLFKSR